MALPEFCKCPRTLEQYEHASALVRANESVHAKDDWRQDAGASAFTFSISSSPNDSVHLEVPFARKAAQAIVDATQDTLGYVSARDRASALHARDGEGRASYWQWTADMWDAHCWDILVSKDPLLSEAMAFLSQRPRVSLAALRADYFRWWVRRVGAEHFSVHLCATQQTSFRNARCQAVWRTVERAHSSVQGLDAVPLTDAVTAV